MHMRHCIASFIYEHGVMDHIDTEGHENAQSERLQALCKKLKVHMAKSKTQKRKKKDSDKSHNPKPEAVVHWVE